MSILTNCGEVERTRIEERLRHLDDRILPRQGQWDDNQDWLTNAETEHYRRPFHAILAKINPRELDFILEGDSLDETHPLWNVPTSQTVPRIAEKMAACIAPLLRVSKEIIFIDPHFGPENARHRRSLTAFLVAIIKHRQGLLPTRIEIHTNIKSAPDFFKQECEHQLPNIVPEGLSIRIVRWLQKDGGEKLHNRYILTEIGGIDFGTGLDAGAAGETDDVKLLEYAHYKQRWEQYAGTEPAFDFVDEVIIGGKRRF